MGPVADLEILRACPLFAALEDDATRSFHDQLERRSLAAGEAMFQEGDASHTMYVILEGQIEIVKSAAAGSFRVALLGEGQWFGEVGLIGVSRRVATARACRPTRLVEIPARELRELYKRDIKSYALFTMNLARGLARKLQLAETMLADAQPKNS